MLRGHFITVEGGEGVGKSTQCRRIIELLRSFEVEAILTREPGGSDGADQIRQLLVTGAEDRWDPLAEALLLFAARRDHVVRTVIPALETGIWVVCDRFYDSTLAYQGYGHGIDRKFLNALNKRVNGNLEPEITFILDAPTKVGIARALKRGGTEDRYERLMDEFHERARQGFLKIASAQPDRCVVIDGTEEIGTVASNISNKLVSHFNLERRKTSGRSTLSPY
ncbi:dTMP kinase [Bradyrhizobium sp. AZCC 2289]|uniref:dTMP kinase n=1 Tax=Bradyrhizobium sp. AZCC 2289 TaxID=3117026 RepID=UPI002FF05735